MSKLYTFDWKGVKLGVTLCHICSQTSQQRHRKSLWLNALKQKLYPKNNRLVFANLLNRHWTQYKVTNRASNGQGVTSVTGYI